MVEGGVSDGVYRGVGRGIEEASCCVCAEGAGETDLPEDSCRGAGGLDPEDSPSFAFFACDVFSEGPLLCLMKLGVVSGRSFKWKSEISMPSSFRPCR